MVHSLRSVHRKHERQHLSLSLFWSPKMQHRKIILLQEMVMRVEGGAGWSENKLDAAICNFLSIN